MKKVKEKKSESKNDIQERRGFCESATDLGGSMVWWLGRCDFCDAGSSSGHDTAWLFLR